MRASDRSILRLTPVQRGFLEELRGTRYIACGGSCRAPHEPNGMVTFRDRAVQVRRTYGDPMSVLCQFGLALYVGSVDPRSSAASGVRPDTEAIHVYRITEVGKRTLAELHRLAEAERRRKATR